VSMKLGARALCVCLSSLVISAFCLSTPSAIEAGPAAAAANSPSAAPGSSLALAADYGNLPLSFERNDGQTDAQVKFFSRGSGYSMFLTAQGAVLVLTKHTLANDQTNAPSKNNGMKNSIGNHAVAQITARKSAGKVTATVLRLQLAGEKLKAAPEISGLAQLPGRSNYFRGKDPQHWVSNIPNYQQVRYREVYPGIDLVYYGNQRQLEYDMVVAPHADASAIRFQVQGTSGMEVTTAGDLMLHTANGDVTLHKPVLYQAAPASAAAGQLEAGTSSAAVTPAERETVQGNYLIQGNEIRFQVGAYDSSRPLVIDPVLSYSTFLGGSSFDQGSAIAVDSGGNAYVTGVTNSPDFPTTNTINPFNQGEMVFITKLKPTGTSVVYSTFLGGITPQDSASGIAIDSSSPANVYVSGTTIDGDFPTTSSNAYATSPPNPNASNVFISKLNGTGDTLLYSTYLGGTDNNGTFQPPDSGNSIAADAGGNAYISGNTSSDNFPTVNGYLAADPFGPGSAFSVPFVSKINTNGTGLASLVYSTYLGGKTGSSNANGVASNGQGKVYVTGFTNESDFPIKNAYQGVLAADSQNAFVTVLDTAQSGNASLFYSTYLGGTDIGSLDSGTGIAVDSTGKIDATGTTSSTKFPVTTNAFQSSLAPGGCGNAFVTQLDPGQTGAASLIYSTYLGGDDVLSPCSEEGIGIAADSSGKIYVTGQTDSDNFPTKNPLQAMLPKTQTLGLTVFVSQFDPTQVTGANTLLFSTYLGGSKGLSGDRGFGIALDSTAANIFITGVTDSYDFPALNPLQAYGGDSDGFVAKINMAGASPAILLTPTSLTFNNRAGGTTSGPRTVTVKNAGNASLVISAISFTNSTFSLQSTTCGTLPATLAAGATCTISVVYSPPVAGNWSANMVITSNSLGSPHIVPIRGAGANVALTSSLNPSTYFDTVTFTATVTSTIQTGIPLQGTVEFLDGSNSIDIENVGSSSIVNGVLTAVVPFVTSSLPVGTHSITAVYEGDGFRTGSNPSNVITQTVNQAATTTTVTSSLNPSAFGAGPPPIFTATVTATNGLTTPLGTVTFKDGTTVLGTGTLDDSGQTAFTPASNTTLALGHHFITAIYQDDVMPANWSGSTSAVLDQAVNQPSASNLKSNLSGQSPLTVYFTRNPAKRLLILTMTVTGNFGTPTGNVSFSDGDQPLGLAALSTVNATTATAVLQLTTPLPVGLNQIVAAYPGDNTYAGTSSTLAIYQSPRPKIH